METDFVSLMDKQPTRSKDYLVFGKPNYGDDEVEAVSRVLRSGWVGMGPETEAFELELAKFIGVEHVITTNSCTSGLFLSLLVNGINEGDEVICPSLTWCSTANAILYTGATPVFCDVDPDTLNLTPDSVLDKITPRTRAIIVVHMGGLAVNVSDLRNVLPDHVKIIEDAAHAFGSYIDADKMVGSSGNLTCFSFYANKNLSTGEGGAICLKDDSLANKLKSLRQNNLAADAWKRYIKPESSLMANISELGYKMNYMDLLAAIGRVQLSRQSEFKRSRSLIADIYNNYIRSELPDISVQDAVVADGHAKHLFVIKLPIETMDLTRNEVLLAFRERNVGASIHYTPLHRMSLYQDYGNNLQVTDYIAERIMTLPISASMTNSDAEYVMQTLCDVLQ